MQAEYWGLIKGGKYLQAPTSSGQTTILLSEVIAWQTTEEGRYNLHMSSGTIFTLNPKTQEHKEVSQNAFTKWIGKKHWLEDTETRNGDLDV